MLPREAVAAVRGTSEGAEYMQELREKFGGKGLSGFIRRDGKLYLDLDGGWIELPNANAPRLHDFDADDVAQQLGVVLDEFEAKWEFVPLADVEALIAN